VDFVNVARHEAEPGSEQPGNACGDDKSEARHQDDDVIARKTGREVMRILLFPSCELGISIFLAT
jgi:hypothetical protein